MSPTAAVQFSRCISKGCVYQALPLKEHCRNHLPTPEVPAPVKPPEHEIVPMSQVPTFRIQNERAFNFAKCVGTLQPENALKIKAGTKKESQTLGVAIVNYAKRSGFTAKYRTAPGFLYAWKVSAAKK